MRAFERYESYKSSNIEWIGDIPSHWGVARVKFIANAVLGKMLCPTDKGDYHLKPYLKSKNIGWLNVITNDVEEMWFSKTEMERFRVRKDDLLVSEGGEVGKTCLWNDELEECYIQNSVHKITVNEDGIPEYYLYLFFSMGKIGYFDSIVNRISIGHLTWEKLINTSLTVPPLEEQKQIADFLDIKSNQIDEFIADKQALIALFEEQKSAIINEAVTKGLDKTAPLKPSGIEWLGDIPSHWETKKLKFSTLINNKTLTDKTDKDYVIRYVDIGNVDKNGLVGEPEQLRFEDAPSRARRIVSDGDTIISTVRTYLKALAYFERADDNLIASTGFAVLTSGEKCDEKFLYYFVSSDYFIQQVSYRAVGIMYPSIGLYDIGSIKLLLPPFEEQKQIVEYLQKELSKIDTLIETAKAEITLIEEYKTSLINEVVTGNIKIYNGDKLEKEND